MNATHQLLGGLVLKGGGGDLVVLREKLVIVRLLEVELYVFESFALAQVVVILIIQDIDMGDN